MFEPGSRYYGIETAKMTVGDGDEARVVSYKRRRIIPSHEALVTLVEHSVVQGDRLDNLAARYLGDPEQFWRICDTNNVLRPEELTDEIGRTIEIGLPYP